MKWGSILQQRFSSWDEGDDRRNTHSVPAQPRELFFNGAGREGAWPPLLSAADCDGAESVCHPETGTDYSRLSRFQRMPIRVIQRTQFPNDDSKSVKDITREVFRM